MVRKSVVSIAAVVAMGIGAAGWVVLQRWQQVNRERELRLAWVEIGRSLVRADARFHLNEADFPDEWELLRAADDTNIVRRLDSAEQRIWKTISKRPKENGIDSLREALRRQRERQGLALAHCRGNRSSWGKWILAGFPER